MTIQNRLGKEMGESQIGSAPSATSKVNYQKNGTHKLRAQATTVKSSAAQVLGKNAPTSQPTIPCRTSDAAREKKRSNRSRPKTKRKKGVKKLAGSAARKRSILPTKSESAIESNQPSNDSSPLAKLNRRLSVIHDRVYGVGSGRHNGFYLFGRPGTSKTYTVRGALDENGIKYAYHAGHLTPMGLFELLELHHDHVIVLDDVAHLLQQPLALQILLAALGNQSTDRNVREVRYKRQGREEKVDFSGGIIAISNLELRSGALFEALKSRVNYLKYDPTDEQIQALMYDIASRGWGSDAERMTAEECRQVVDFLVAESRRLGLRLDMRHLVDKGFPDYLQHRSKCTRAHWKDLVRTTLEEQLVDIADTRTGTREAEKLHDQRIARVLVKDYPNRKTQVAKWKKLTNKSKRAFYRRLEEIGGT